MATVVKTGSGKFQASVRLKGHKPRYKTFNSKSAAKHWSEALEDRLKADLPDLDKPLQMTLSKALDRYVEDVGQWHKGYAPVDRYIVKRLKNELGHCLVGALDASALSGYVRKRLEEVTGSTVRREVGYLQRVYNYFQKDLHVDVKWPVVRMPPENRPRERVPTQKELAAIVERLTPDMRDFVILAIETAMRRSEIARIKGEHINVDGSVLYIPVTKNGRPRSIPLTDNASRILRERSSGGMGLLFHCHPSSVSHAFNKACKALEIEGVCFHSLRHKRITELFEMGWTAEQVRVVSGHLDGRMLSRYSHIQASSLVRLLRAGSDSTGTP